MDYGKTTESLRKKLFAYFFLFLVLLIFGIVLYMVYPFWQPITLALISAVVFYPLQRSFQKIFRLRLISSFLTITAVFGLIIVPLVVSLLILGQELLRLSQTIDAYLQGGHLNLLVKQIRAELMLHLYKFQLKYPLLKDLLSEENLQRWITEASKFVAAFITKTTKEMLVWSAHFAFALFIYMLTLFFALYQGDKALKEVKKLIPLEEKDKEEIFRTIYNAVTGVIYGTVGTAILQGVAALGLYYYYGLSYPFLWAMATAFFAFIPPFGTAYVWFPLTLFVMLKVNLVKGLLGLAYGVIVIGSIDNIVRPLLMKEKIELPYVFLFFAVVGGLFAFGFTGLFLGPTIFALFITLIKLYERKFV
jgi:predicted PurR-regulated permease PerM